MPEPRVAVVIRNLSGGGAERAFLTLTSHTDRLRCVPVVEWREGALLGDAAAESCRFLSEHELPRAQRAMRLAALLRQLRPHVVVSCLSAGIAAAAGELVRTPVVHWVQNPLRPADAATWIPWRVQRAVLGGIARRAAFVACVSPPLATEWQQLGVPAWRTGVLPNPIVIDSASTERDSSNRDERAPQIVAVGRLTPQKRHDLILTAVADLARHQPVELDIVGVGPCEPELRDRARQLGIAASVRWHGFVNNPQRLIANADVFVLASDYEGFGNVLVEALAAGVRVVATDAPHGPRFVLDGGRLGELVPTGSSSELAGAIARAIANGPPARVERERALARARMFAPEPVVERFVDIVRSVLSGDLRSRSFAGW